MAPRKSTKRTGWPKRAAGVLLAAALPTSAACETATARPQQEPAPIEVKALPAPHIGTVSLDGALSARRSIREFAGEPLSQDQIAQLFWSAQGITATWGGRTAPSAGALYPLEIYVATADGVQHYVPRGHRAALLSRDDVRSHLALAGGNQGALRNAPALFVITAVIARTAAKYGDRAELYAHLETGHAAQNLLLEATSLGLGAVPIGAFAADEVRRVLGIPDDQAPLYIIAVGKPR